MALKIYASGITDLTSARYFSAMNVEILGFEVNPQKYSQINEMIQWVSVPYIAAEINEIDPMLENYADSNDWINYIVSHLEFKSTKTRLTTIEMKDFSNSVFCENLIVKVDKPINEYDHNISQFGNKHNIFFDIDGLNISDVDYLIKNNIYGIVMHAKSEDIVGIQSFDLYDEIFDQLEKL